MANLPEESVWLEGIYQLDGDDDVFGGPLPEGMANLQAKQLGDRTRYLKDGLQTEADARNSLGQHLDGKIDAETSERVQLAMIVEDNTEAIETNTGDIGSMAQRVETLEGRGGPVDAHDFGSETPTAEALTRYACENIWGTGGTWTWNSGAPWDSTYVIGGVTHTAEEIFSSTWVRNTYNALYHDQGLARSKMEAAFGAGGVWTWNAADPAQSTYVVNSQTHYLVEIAGPYTLNHKWVLTNTSDTVPRVFSWQNVGQDTVAIANELLPGVVKSGGDIRVDPVTGAVVVVSGGDGPYQKFSYVVDSDTKLADWANNVGGNDYSSVLIAKGTWTLNMAKTGGSASNPVCAIDLSLAGTKRITGAQGSELVFNNDSDGTSSYVSCISGQVTGAYPNLVDPDDGSRDYSITGVRITCNVIITSDRFYGFYNCANITNCTVSGTYSGFYNCANITNCTVSGNGIGFQNCTNIMNCTGTCVSTTGGNCHGFYNCANITNCTGIAAPKPSAGVYYGFRDCTNIMNCTGTGVNYRFYGCRMMLLNKPGSAESANATYNNCYVGYSTSSGTPADTAAGGWNRA